MSRILRFLATASGLLLAGLAGCRSQEAMAPAQMKESAVDLTRTPAEAKPASMKMQDQTTEMDDAPGDAQTVPAAQEQKPRMVVYQGDLQLKVTNSGETLERAVRVGEEAGGYVELLAETSVVLRVPVARFKEVFESLLNLGRVLSRAIRADDVTDQYAAMELRLEILKASRSRLMALLGRDSPVKSKLRLLGEINRLTDTIDQIERSLQTTLAAASFSRITLEALANKLELSSAQPDPVAAFRWIYQLSPFGQAVAAEGDSLELEVPAGMVELEDRSCWMAEGADGSAIWAHERENQPEGTSQFWLDVLRARIAPQFAAAEEGAVGEWKMLRLLFGKEETAYRYWIALRAAGDDLEVVEVRFSNAESEGRHQEAVRQALQGGAT